MRLLLESCINITAGLFGADTLHIPPQVTKQDMPHVVFERRTWAESVGDILKSALWHTRCLLGTVTVPEQAQAHSSYRQRRRQDRARVVLRYDVLTERQRCRNKSSLYYQKHPYSSLSQMGWEPFPCHAFMQSLKLLLFVARSVVCRSWGSVSCSPDNCATRCTHYALVKIWACEKRRVFLLVNTSAQTCILMNCTDGDKCICPFYAMAALTLCAVMTRWQIQRLWAKNCIFSKGHSSLTRPPGGN